MDPASLLAQLRDIQAPEKIGAWPPALGLVILIVLIIFLTATAILFAYRWYQKNAWRRSALKELKTLQARYLLTPSNADFIEISCLMKRCVASMSQDSSILAMTGDDWKKLLQNTKSPLEEEEINLLCYAHYQENFTHLDASALLRIRQWIKSLPSTSIISPRRVATEATTSKPQSESKAS